MNVKEIYKIPVCEYYLLLSSRVKFIDDEKKAQQSKK